MSETLRAARRIIPATYRPGARSVYHRAAPSRRRASLVARLHSQATVCQELGSPLYGGLLDRVATDVELQGPCWKLLDRRQLHGRPFPVRDDQWFPLGLMGAMHALVLKGRAPELERYFRPGAGPVAAEAWPAFSDVVARRADELRVLLGRPVQTNEVGRCSALVGGFLLVARDTELPLRILEVGASAGLNLRWDRYGYEFGANRWWGDPASPVRLAGSYTEGLPPFDVSAQVIERRGCDRNPLDPGSRDDCLTLRSWVWADQGWRMALLEAALGVARSTSAPVDRADAAEWLAMQLATPVAGAATVVFHSFVWWFLGPRRTRSIRRSLAHAGGRATESAPLFWLRMENGRGRPKLRLTRWPPGSTTLIATAGAHAAGRHGLDVRWLAD